MTHADVAARMARRAALFGPASGRHRAAQPIPRGQPTGPRAQRPDEQARATAIRAADRTVLQSGTRAQVERQVLAILAGSTRRSVAELEAGDLFDDGTLALDSMLAVFVCRIVAEVLGPRGWTRLRGNCEPQDFVSVRSVAGLVARLRRAVAIA